VPAGKVTGRKLINGVWMYYATQQSDGAQMGYIKWDDMRKIKGSHHDPNSYRLQQFNTGGYTGVWGPEGKLALLHEKELVLNASDT